MALPGMPDARPTSPAASRPIPEPAPQPASDWPKQATDSVVRLVDSVRDKTTGPALSAARWLVYGTALALLAIPLVVFGLILVMRLCEHALLKLGEWRQWSFLSDPMWIVYVLFGAVFTLIGLQLWHKAKRIPAPSSY